MLWYLLFYFLGGVRNYISNLLHDFCFFKDPGVVHALVPCKNRSFTPIWGLLLEIRLGMAQLCLPVSTKAPL